MSAMLSCTTSCISADTSRFIIVYIGVDRVHWVVSKQSSSVSLKTSTYHEYEFNIIKYACLTILKFIIPPRPSRRF